MEEKANPPEGGEVEQTGDPLANADQKATNSFSGKNPDDVSLDPENPENPTKTPPAKKENEELDNHGEFRRQHGEYKNAFHKALVSENPKNALIDFLENDPNARKHFEKSFGNLEDFKNSEKPNNDGKTEIEAEKKEVSEIAKTIEGTIDEAEMNIEGEKLSSKFNLKESELDKIKELSKTLLSSVPSLKIADALKSAREIVFQTKSAPESKKVPLPGEKKGFETIERKDGKPLSAKEFAKQAGLVWKSVE
jgi:hypothetical protein